VLLKKFYKNFIFVIWIIFSSIFLKRNCLPCLPRGNTRYYKSTASILHLSVYPSTHKFIHLSSHLPIYLSVYVFFYLSVYLPMSHCILLINITTKQNTGKTCSIYYVNSEMNKHKQKWVNTYISKENTRRPPCPEQCCLQKRSRKTERNVRNNSIYRHLYL